MQKVALKSDLHTIVPFPKELPENVDYRRLIYALEEKMATLPNVKYAEDFPLRHSFVEGVYMRELYVPRGIVFITELHRDSYVSYLTQGMITMLVEEGLRGFRAPAPMLSPAWTKRFVYVHEDAIWLTVHPNHVNTMDIDVLDKQIHAEKYERDYVKEFGVFDKEKVDKVYNTFMRLIEMSEEKRFRSLMDMSENRRKLCQV